MILLYAATENEYRSVQWPNAIVKKQQKSKTGTFFQLISGRKVPVFYTIFQQFPIFRQNESIQSIALL